MSTIYGPAPASRWSASAQRSSRQRQNLGRLGEDLACEYLEEAGWRIVARNVARRGSEIDVIATKANVVVFVEVRTRRGVTQSVVAESITPAKLARIRAGAAAWLRAHPDLGKPRIDTITVTIRGRQARLCHYRAVG